MPRPSRICSILDCGRRHHAKGFCRRHYGEQVRKSAEKKRSQSRASQIAQNTITAQSIAASAIDVSHIRAGGAA